MCDSRLILLLNMLTLHFYTQIIIHIKNASMLDSCPFPWLQIPCILKPWLGINFYVLRSMYSIIILVKLYIYMQTIFVLNKEYCCACTQKFIQTHTHIHAIMSCPFNYLKNHIHFHDPKGFKAWPYFPIFTPKENDNFFLNCFIH